MAGTAKAVATATLAVAGGAAVATLALVAALSSPDLPLGERVVGVVAFGLWALSPYLGVVVVVVGLVRWLPDAIGALIGCVVLIGLAVGIYLYAFLVHPDPQSPLVLIFVPIYQWMGVVVVAAVVGLLRLRRRRP